ncbi:MAG: hypothetical protein A2842_02105 [Candidatus Wildermuthbacteria bacterium RIFCSPHIGHO2_01_FULL_48_25]|uniref:PilN domain-containing protein n=1 Tax=Candidatus Wildermuthbacteria bacterium RIFCSPLOWO2_01_FULL_48_16 TaxID=1802461 RepID=A0A1G2RK68_9BACT|nr:MAG: hypothetical protein A2842_02105 [Candidatus Wildermuthbacteria bacterium RIFCSPHIGHO2_01_FULL_48_25]OHA73177.1 MAG: hypothetical protein A3B24_00835 [Candidatus Wildermuthbacteria bacterium RIFCSPLOWO2_01_FULL_48_16]
MQDLIPKTQSESFFTKNTVLYTGISLLVLSAGLFVLFQVLKGNTEQSTAELNTVLLGGKTSQERELERSVLGYQKRIEYFSSFLKSQDDTLPFFAFLEARTHPSVFFNDARLNVQENRMVLSGQSTDFGSLGEQIASFEGQQELRNVKLTDVSLSKGQVLFTMELTFAP